MVIGYVTLGTNDLERATGFYDALFAEVGAGRIMESERFVFYATGPGSPAVSIMKPHDGNEASVGNGVMVALLVDSPEKVDALHAKAMELGGTDEGAPGPRGPEFYFGYFRDLDGNKLTFFHMAG